MSCFPMTEKGSREKVSKRFCGFEVFSPGKKMHRGQVSFSSPSEILRGEGCSCGVRRAVYICTAELDHE